ncbi:phosphoserine phosphatase [Phenylobacterium zucineum HLK1]|uniref:Phosphoserine phosphatase n=1 Tax=Phenylobacterium zucineum (strain HLK1) TaxID=450851 RepID=B4RCN9_PHEZH|nr:HAD-IB family hydrolase [Phenylobacterium zucineum]ACG78226.1 phosphoserine phosphatase [Phenylobacterium zucineum HLK1]
MAQVDEPAADAPVVAFDFDGTLTIKDSFTAFLKWRAGPLRWWLGCLRLAPAALAYLFHRDRGRIKAAAVRVFLRGVPHDRLESDARRFAADHARRLLRPDAVATWKRWRERGARIVIVTASPDIVVAPFGRGLGAHLILGTQLSFDAQNRVLGAFSGPNCRGAEKVVRLHEVFGPDLRLAAAYGDTSGDTEMLAIADEAGFRVFKGRP